MFFNNKKNGVFVECGANDGYDGSITWLFEDKFAWTGVLLEPNPHCFKILTKKRPNCTNLSKALSDSDGNHTLVFPTDGSRGILAAVGSLEGSRGFGGRPTEKHTVETIKYETLFSKNNELGIEHIDLFVLDVENHELESLSTVTEDTVLPDVWVIETNKTPESEVMKILGPLGYIVVGGDKDNSYIKRTNV